MKATTIQSLALALSMASAHSIMQQVGVGSTINEQGVGIYMPSDDSYIGDVTSDSLACNGAPVTGFTSSSSVINVQAGDTVTGSWLHTLTSTGADSEADNKVIASSHKAGTGPILAYMKKVSDATQNPSAGPGDGWFKIAEAGLISSTEWGVDALIAAGGVHNVTIPTCIEDGDYLLRFEIIALHSAYSVGGAQFYMECAQISVSGGAGSTSPSTVAIPGVYSATDPGIDVNIYNSQGQPYPDSYIIPGPSVFSCPAGTATSAPVSSIASPATTSVKASSSTTTTTSSVKAISSTTTTISVKAISTTTTTSSAKPSTTTTKPTTSSSAKPVTTRATTTTTTQVPTTFITSAKPTTSSAGSSECNAY